MIKIAYYRELVLSNPDFEYEIDCSFILLLEKYIKRFKI